MRPSLILLSIVLACASFPGLANAKSARRDIFDHHLTPFSAPCVKACTAMGFNPATGRWHHFPKMGFKSHAHRY